MNELKISEKHGPSWFQEMAKISCEDPNQIIARVNSCPLSSLMHSLQKTEEIQKQNSS